jgi:hypothetical protein
MEQEFGFWDRLSQKRKEQSANAIKKRANDIYQISECFGKLWFTYNGFPFCPCDMMKDEPLVALNKLREGYIDMHTR